MVSAIEARHRDVTQLSPQAVNQSPCVSSIDFKKITRSLQSYGVQLCVYSFLAVTQYIVWAYDVITITCNCLMELLSTRENEEGYSVVVMSPDS